MTLGAEAALGRGWHAPPPAPAAAETEEKTAEGGPQQEAHGDYRQAASFWPRGGPSLCKVTEIFGEAWGEAGGLL